MCKKDYASLLYEKVQAEHDDFIAEMKCKPAEEIIESAYQIVIKDEITVFCRDCSPKLTDRQFEALLSEAGFSTASIHLKEGTDWICAEATK